ncbi:hypothetical protein OAT84_01065 [Gammaproteobacteria bacterium]|nr:hypothetical protein [Gammaproteobacteria bacterium]
MNNNQSPVSDSESKKDAGYNFPVPIRFILDVTGLIVLFEKDDGSNEFHPPFRLFLTGMLGATIGVAAAVGIGPLVAGLGVLLAWALTTSYIYERLVKPGDSIKMKVGKGIAAFFWPVTGLGYLAYKVVKFVASPGKRQSKDLVNDEEVNLPGPSFKGRRLSFHNKFGMLSNPLYKGNQEGPALTPSSAVNAANVAEGGLNRSRSGDGSEADSGVSTAKNDRGGGSSP